MATSRGARHAASLADLPDDVLSDRARDGDTRSFEALLRRHERTMFAVAVRITASVPDAEDAVQSAFLTAWRRLPTFRGEAGFATWLYRIVTNQAVTVLRRRRPDVPLPDERVALQPAALVVGDAPVAHAQGSALAGALTVALAALSDELRVVWVLREIDGCSYDEVAAIVGESPSTVRGRLARARRQLATSMAGWR